MKLAIKNLVVDIWKIYFVAVIFLSILQNSDVSAVTRKKSMSKHSPSFSRSPPAEYGSSTMQNNRTPGKGVPSSILSEIRSLDNHLLCFPKLLCTIYQDDSIAKRHPFLNTTELGVAYLKLLKAVHYMSPTASTATTHHVKVKQPIIQVFQIPTGLIKSSTYSGRKDHHDSDDLQDYPYHLRSPLLYTVHDDDNVVGGGGRDDYNLESENPLGDDDDDVGREFLKEKIEISQMIQDLKQEDEAEEYAEDPSSLGTLSSTLLSSFLPFMGSRSIKGRSVTSSTSSGWNFQPKDRRKRAGVITHTQNERKRRLRRQHVSQYSSGTSSDPFWKAVSLWKKLKSRSQCRDMYATCPFEAWEIVRMLDLVKGQSKVLSAYLKITVDNVKPKRRIRS